jgi:hypothetical protein
VPIIKFEDSEHGIPVNICFGQADGLANTDLVRGFLRDLPALRPLVLVLKQFLYNRDLHETFTGGVGSYLLTMTVVSHLQHHPGRGPALAAPERNLGALLLDYLHLYGLRLNMSAVGLSVRAGGAYFDKARRGWAPAGKAHLLCVEDPNSPESDLGRGSFNVRSVQRAFEHAYYTLAVPRPAPAGLAAAAAAAAAETTALGRVLQWDQRWDSALALHRLARFKRAAPARAAAPGAGGGEAARAARAEAKAEARAKSAARAKAKAKARNSGGSAWGAKAAGRGGRSARPGR